MSKYTKYLAIAAIALFSGIRFLLPLDVTNTVSTTNNAAVAYQIINISGDEIPPMQGYTWAG